MEGDVFRTIIPLKVQEDGGFDKYHFTKRQQDVLRMIKDNQSIQVENIMDALSISRSTVMREIQEIKKQLRLSYDKKTNEWILEE